MSNILSVYTLRTMLIMIIYLAIINMVIRVNCNKSVKVLKRSTLGQQPIVLGGFYSEIQNEFLPAMTLWSKEVIERNKVNFTNE